MELNEFYVEFIRTFNDRRRKGLAETNTIEVTESLYSIIEPHVSKRADESKTLFGLRCEVVPDEAFAAKYAFKLSTKIE